MSKAFFLAIGLLFTVSVVAQDLYSFSSKNKQQQFTTLTQELRCLVCQNESLDASNAPLAADLRQKIYEQVQAGYSNAQIKQYMVARYGNFILFKPPLIASTFLLWLMPFMLLVIGGFIWWRVVRCATQQQPLDE